MFVVKLNLVLIWSLITITICLVNAQNCRFEMYMGDKYDKCAAICEGRTYKCVADGVCLCQSCPNGNDYGYVHTHEDVTCDFWQECSRKCMEVNSEPEYGGNIGRGKKCNFIDDFYGNKASVCACACI